MTDELKQIHHLEKELAQLKAKIEQKESRPSAEQWLLNYLEKEPFTVKITDGFITYYRDDQWIFQQDLKNGKLWCYYHKVWLIFEVEYSMTYEQIQDLHRNVVGKSLNCEGLTAV